MTTFCIAFYESYLSKLLTQLILSSVHKWQRILLTSGTKGSGLFEKRMKRSWSQIIRWLNRLFLYTTFFDHCIFLLLSCLLISGCRADPEKHELSLEAYAHLLYEKKLNFNCWFDNREYWMMIYRGPGFLAVVVWFYDFPPPSPHFPLSSQQVSLFFSLPVCRRSSLHAGGGWGRSQIIRRRESLVLSQTMLVDVVVR